MAAVATTHALSAPALASRGAAASSSFLGGSAVVSVSPRTAAPSNGTKVILRTNCDAKLIVAWFP